jgi:hypothetical protein
MPLMHPLLPEFSFYFQKRSTVQGCASMIRRLDLNRLTVKGLSLYIYCTSVEQRRLCSKVKCIVKNVMDPLVVALWQSMLHFGTVKKYSCWEMRNALP